MKTLAELKSDLSQIASSNTGEIVNHCFAQIVDFCGIVFTDTNKPSADHVLLADGCLIPKANLDDFHHLNEFLSSLIGGSYV